MVNKNEGVMQAVLDASPVPLSEQGEFVAASGLVLAEVSGSRVVGHVELGRQHHTPWGVVHGGLYATVVETAASIGASVAAAGRSEFAVGLSNSTDFLRSAREGRADVVAEPIMQGRTQQLWQVTISRHEDGKALARGTVRLQNVPLNR
jgi:1,4-dihydroxy-2-naphthoyl-CoA hydrolase